MLFHSLRLKVNIYAAAGGMDEAIRELGSEPRNCVSMGRAIHHRIRDTEERY